MRTRFTILLVLWLASLGAGAAPSRFFQHMDSLRPNLKGDGKAWMRGFEFGPSGPSIGLLVEENPAVQDWVFFACSRLRRRAPERGRLYLTTSAAALQKLNLDVCLVPLASPDYPHGNCSVPHPSRSRIEVVEVVLPASARPRSQALIGQAVLELQTDNFDGVDEASLRLERFTPTGAKLSLKSYDEDGRQHSIQRIQAYFDRELPAPDRAVVRPEPTVVPLEASFSRRVRAALTNAYGADHVTSRKPVEDEILHQPSWVGLPVPGVRMWMNQRSPQAPGMLETALRALLTP